MVSMMAMLGMLADDNAFQPTIAALALVFLASLGAFLITAVSLGLLS